MKGRFHYYEGWSMKEVTFPERVMYELGIEQLFVSNAAGGMCPDFRIGDLMVITDHINFFPEHPLHGPNFPTGPRFPDMHKVYDPQLMQLFSGLWLLISGRFLNHRSVHPYRTRELVVEEARHALVGIDGKLMKTPVGQYTIQVEQEVINFLIPE